MRGTCFFRYKIKIVFSYRRCYTILVDLKATIRAEALNSLLKNRKCKTIPEGVTDPQKRERCTFF